MSISKLFPARHFASSWRSVSERSCCPPRRSLSSCARRNNQNQEYSSATRSSVKRKLHTTKWRNSDHRRWTSSDAATNNSILELSPITEPPLDGDILERPCTVILMEDLCQHTIDDNNKTIEPVSWLPVFESRIPNECGMSFASISFKINTSSPTLSVANCIQVLKNSQLPRIHDAVLVARGPFSSICAQYYLESLPLQGLIMVDPILLGDDGENNDKAKEILANIQIEESEYSRFLESSLLLEPNAVSMMAVTSHRHEAWNEASRRVAARHSAEEGPYGMVPVVDLIELTGASNQSEADKMVDLIDEWVDENVL